MDLHTRLRRVVCAKRQHAVYHLLSTLGSAGEDAAPLPLDQAWDSPACDHVTIILLIQDWTPPHADECHVVVPLVDLLHLTVANVLARVLSPRDVELFTGLTHFSGQLVHGGALVMRPKYRVWLPSASGASWRLLDELALYRAVPLAAFVASDLLRVRRHPTRAGEAQLTFSMRLEECKAPFGWPSVAQEALDVASLSPGMVVDCNSAARGFARATVVVVSEREVRVKHCNSVAACSEWFPRSTRALFPRGAFTTQPSDVSLGEATLHECALDGSCYRPLADWIEEAPPLVPRRLAFLMGTSQTAAPGSVLSRVFEKSPLREPQLLVEILDLAGLMERPFW